MTPPDELDDTDECWREVRLARQAKRAENRTSSTDTLTRSGVAFESKNNGVHLICRSGELVVDFWPSTGLYIDRATGRKGRGVKNLIQLMNTGGKR